MARYGGLRRTIYVRVLGAQKLGSQQHTSAMRWARHDLHGAVMNREIMFQVLRERVNKSVTGRPLRHDQMDR